MTGVAEKLQAIPGSLKGPDRAKLVEAALEPLQAMRGEVTSYQANELLWNTYDPWIIWLILGGIGLVSVAGMVWMYIRAPAKDPGASSDSNEQAKPDENKEGDGAE